MSPLCSAQLVQEGIDSLDASLSDLLVAIPPTDHTDYRDDSTLLVHDRDDQSNFADDDNNGPAVGDLLDILWDENNVVYPGVVHSQADDGTVTIHYDSGEVEADLDMTIVHWNHSEPTLLAAASSSLSGGNLQVTSTEAAVLNSMLEQVGNKPFLRHQAQGFDQYSLVNAYAREEETFLKTARPVYQREVPPGANVISSHTLYKLKHNDNNSFRLKARIAPHGNKDALKNVLSTDCSTCPPAVLRVLESIASLFGWKLYRADVKAAFLQTGAAQRDVYVRPPKESAIMSSHVWLLLTAAYGLVNANAKWQSQFDAVMIALGIAQSKSIPQLFYKKNDGKLTLLVAKIVDDLKAAGTEDNALRFLEEFDKKLKFAEINSGPGKLCHFGQQHRAT